MNQLRDALRLELEPLREQIDELIRAQRETLLAAGGARTAAERAADAGVGFATAVDQLTERLDALEFAHRQRTNGGCGHDDR